MNKITLGLTGLIFSFIFNQSVFAYQDNQSMWWCGEGMKHIVDSLKLESAQQAKVKAIMEELRSKIKPIKAQMKNACEQVMQETFSEKMDQSKLDSAINAKLQLIGAMMKARIMAKHQIYGVLNAEQKMKYKEMVKQRAENMSKKFEQCHQQ